MISKSLTELAARINEAFEAVASAQKGTSNMRSRLASYFKRQRVS
jgi:hypothetical protein